MDQVNKQYPEQKGLQKGFDIRLQQILEANKNKNFVNRIINKDPNKILKNEDGSHSTHSMSYAGVNDGYLVYPTVVETEGKLMRLDDKQAFDYAVKNKEFIHFKDENTASNFSKNYKRFWDKDFGKKTNK